MATRTKPRPSLGVDWHLPNPKGGLCKRPFASTTPASADLIAVLAESGATWKEIATAILCDPEARGVALAFVEAGHGDIEVSSMLAAP